MPVYDKSLLNDIQQKYRRLCGWTRRGFPGFHPVHMHRGNYQMILRTPYMVTWKPVGKRYMMLIEEEDKVYMLDQGDHVFTVDHIQFPCDVECTSHLKNTLIDGEFVIDKVDGLNKPRFLINDIIMYNDKNVSKKPFPDRLELISQLIVNIRNKAITKGYIKKATQPFSIVEKPFFDSLQVPKLLSSKFLATIPHEVEGFIFLPKYNSYSPGECPWVLKWKENETIDFLLRISVNSSKIGALPEKKAYLFLNRMDTPFATIPYFPNLQEYDNKIISCSYKDSQWHVYRLRDDRLCPNSEKTAENIMDAVKRPVTREALCDLIRNQ
jgi:mRNA-capping enzyme